MISRNRLGKCLIALSVTFLCSTALWAGQWTALGPEGGDVRSLAYDPHNSDQIFLGTSTGELFLSRDGGRNWSRLAQLGSGDDYVLDHIVINPRDTKVMYIAAWSPQSQQVGDLFRSRDGGKSWETLPAMHNKSIRALAMAASDPQVLVTGALDGVFRSRDGGRTFEQISPVNHAEIKNIESVAVDPRDPNVVYAGTWHLAWKTEDGGANWHHINKGMVDDSDVFSIVVDSNNPANVFASACSGIYKSVTAGELFQKIQGIPFSARRTRVLRQDPGNPSIIYAGTTEGLWKTADLGKTWKRVSNPEMVVNDVLVDPANSQHVLLATDRSGVLVSNDGAATWTASNHGYTHRYVAALVEDQKDRNKIYAGVVNDREWGGMFYTDDAGQHWMQRSTGLNGRDVFALQQAGSGVLVAGTNKGLFLLEHNATTWRPINVVETEKTRMVRPKGAKKAVPLKTRTRSVLEAKVNDIEVYGERWIAATTQGLYLSKDQGKIWMGGPVLGQQDFVAVRASGGTIAAATRTGLLISRDGGSNWSEHSLASKVTAIRGVALTPDAQIFVASREGAFHSADGGATWEHVLTGLPDKDITSISWDGSGRRLLATSYQTSVIFESVDSGRTWQRGPDAGYPLRRVSMMHGRFVGATPFDGVIMQPLNESVTASGGASN